MYSYPHEVSGDLTLRMVRERQDELRETARRCRRTATTLRSWLSWARRSVTSAARHAQARPARRLG